MSFSHLLVKPAVIGAAAFGISSYYTVKGQDDLIYLFGAKVPIPLAIGGAVAVGSWISEAAHPTLFPTTSPVGRMLNAPVAEAVSVGISTAAQMAVLTLGNSQSVTGLGLMYIVGTSIAAQVSGSYLYDKWIAPTNYTASSSPF